LALLRTYSTTSCIYKSSKKLIAKEVFLLHIHASQRKNVHYIVLMIMGEVVAKRDLRDAMYASGKK
jgi:hypothetical protein